MKSNDIAVNLNVKTLKRREFKKNLDCYLYIAPFMIIFFIFTVVPVVMSMILSFTYYNVLEFPKFTGFSNYINLLANDDIFIIAIKNTLTMAIFVGPIGYLLQLMFAWFINELSPYLRFIMVTILYAPILSGGAIMIWSVLFSDDSQGYLNGFLLGNGFISSPIRWITDKNYMIWVAIIITIWMSLGAGFLSFVAGFRTIDKSQYEAGYVEGIRNRWQELWFITLPSMRPQMMFAAVMSITGMFAIDVSYLFGLPSRDYAVHTIMNHLYDYGNIRFEMGYACAIASVLFIIMLTTNSLVHKMIGKVGQ